MLLEKSSSFEIEDDYSSIIDYIPSPPIFLPRTDHNINLFLKSQINTFIDISLPKNETYQENKIKEEDAFDASNTSILENIFKFSLNAIDNEINNIIELEEPESPKLKKDKLNNSLNKNVSKNSVSEKNKRINAKKIFLTVYPERISLFTKAKNNISFSKEKANNELIGKKKEGIKKMI